MACTSLSTFLWLLASLSLVDQRVKEQLLWAASIPASQPETSLGFCTETHPSNLWDLPLLQAS